MTEELIKAKELLHFDPITILIVIAGVLMTWANMKSTTRWHTDWIKTHDKECDEQRKRNTDILTKLEVSNSRLVTLTESHDHRIERLERQEDRER